MGNKTMVEFSETVLYYTFSTIAQTLAGLFALLAAFVLYRLSILNDEMSFNGGVLADGIKTDEARTLNGEGRYQELLDMAARSNNAGRPTQFRRLKLLVPFHRSLLCWFVFSSSITAIVIFASVFFIPFAPKQQKSDCIAWAAWSVIAGFGICIGSYAILINKSLQFVRQPRPQEKGEQVGG
jgi:hypothetical protein